MVKEWHFNLCIELGALGAGLV